jgi:hypothetical protein
VTAEHDQSCDVCGLRYVDLRTGLNYQDVYRMLWSGSTDASTWKYKRRHTILGAWYAYKRALWVWHLKLCASGPEPIPF